jgi:hypothetical protein
LARISGIMGAPGTTIGVCGQPELAAAAGADMFAKSGAFDFQTSGYPRLINHIRSAGQAALDLAVCHPPAYLLFPICAA